MMSTTNRFFINSSILIEAIKGNKVDLYKRPVSDIDNSLYINETVISEYLFYVLAINGGAAPRTLKESGSIPTIITKNHNLVSALSDFTFLETSSFLVNEVPRLMGLYNLLPNDAIILATCKIHNIRQSASHDGDFVIPCKEEGIELLSEV